MKRLLLATHFLLPAAVFAGGSMGGGGLGKDQQLELTLMTADRAILLSSIPDLGLAKAEVEPDVYRRTRARLAMSETVAVIVNGKELSVKTLNGGIVDLAEEKQLVLKH